MFKFNVCINFYIICHNIHHNCSNFILKCISLTVSDFVGDMMTIV